MSLSSLLIAAVWAIGHPTMALGQSERLPEVFEWSEQGIMTPAKDQGNFGTRWAFADDFRFHESGVYVYDGHSPEQPGGHIILITGWVDDSNVVNGGYWIIKNSAGRRWGEQGFGRAAYGQAGIDDYYVIHGTLKPTSP